MHPERGILRTYRLSDVLSTIPDDPNTLTCQSVDTNYTPRYPPSRPHSTPLIFDQFSHITSLSSFFHENYPIVPSTLHSSWSNVSFYHEKWVSIYYSMVLRPMTE